MGSATFQLNDKEKKVLACFPSPKGDAKTGEYVALDEIARDAFPKKGTSPKTTGNSWVRNSMRKLLRLKLVSHGQGKSGKYARTHLTLKELESLERDRVAAVEDRKAKREERAAKVKANPKAPKAPKKTAS